MTRVIRAMCASALFLPSVLHAETVSSTLVQPSTGSSTLAAPSAALPSTDAEVSAGRAPVTGGGQELKPETIEDLLRHLKVLPGLTGTIDGRAADAAPAMQPVIVTASRGPEPLSQAPGATALVLRSDAEANHASDLGEAVGRAAGVDVPRYGGAGATAGITIRGGRASQALVMQDGRPLNSIGTGDANPSVVPLAAIDRVEIVRGPSGMLYGSSAIGGVVNVITPEPPSAFAGEIAGEGGTFGTIARRVSVGGPIGPVRLLAIESRTTSEGARPNSAFRGENVFGKIAAFENPRIDLAGGSWMSNLGVPGAQPAGDPALRSAWQTQYGNSDVSSLVDEQADRRRFVDGKVTWKPFEGHEASVRTYAEVNETIFRSGTIRFDAFFTPIPLMSHAITGVQAQGVEGQYAAPPPLLPESRIMVGGGWREERLNANEQTQDFNAAPDVVTAGMRGRAEVGSAFTEWTIVPGRGVPVIGGMTLAGGARLDRNSMFGDIANSHAGATFEFGGVALKVAAGTAFRAPTLSDLFYPGSGNPQLRPERGRSIEGGIERRTAGTLVRAGVFQRNVRDQIDWAPDASGKYQPHNVGRVTTTGDELEGSVRWGWMTASGNVTVLRAVQRQEEITAYDTVTYAPVSSIVRERFPAHVPRYTAGALLGADLPDGTGVTLALRAAGARHFYVQSTDFLTGANTFSTKRLAAAAVGTLRVARRMTERVSVWGGVENVTDVRYAAHFGYNGTDQDFPMPGRTFFAGASAAW